jgi:hypothetical protein
MSVDQFAGAIVLILGAIGSLLLVVWQSRCACRCRIGLSDHCYIFDCSREPPNEEELKTLAEEAKSMKDKQKKINKKEDIILDKEDQILKRTASQEKFDFEKELLKALPKPTQDLSRQSSLATPAREIIIEPEPEPEPEPQRNEAQNQLDKIV